MFSVMTFSLLFIKQLPFKYRKIEIIVHKSQETPKIRPKARAKPIRGKPVNPYRFFVNKRNPSQTN